MHEWQAMVREFMVKAEQDCPRKPTVPTLEVARLRHALIREELHEYWLVVDSLFAMKNDDLLHEAADACGDLLYVVIGLAVAWGIDIEPVFLEIHRSNMTKFIDGYKILEGEKVGKWMKGPSYERADVAAILRRQMD